MNVFDWIPAISTSALLGIALWLGQSAIKTRLTRSVEHEFNQKIEAVRAELRISEETFKFELRAKEVQFAALRSGALTGIVNRQAAQEKRRLEAVDQLWAAMQSLGQDKAAAATIATLHF